MTLNLFDNRKRSRWDDLWDDEPADLDGARYYQREAYDAILRDFKDNDSLLALLATGLGKSFLFCLLAKYWTAGDVLILAPRIELVDQARAHLEKMTKAYVEVEQGDYHCSPRGHFVVGSVHSVMQQNRLERMGKNRFGLIIEDEAHHMVSPGFRRAHDFFNAKKLLVTATADRADEKALGQIADKVSYVMDITEGVEAGYLVPVRGKHVTVTEIDLDNVGTTGGKDGEFVQSELDAQMVKAVEGIVRETLRLEPNRQGIAFFPGRRSAELAMHRFNALIPGSACYIDGETETFARKAIVKDFKAGRYKYLCNCDVATEGFDAPPASLIIQGSPTKSRAKYAQRVGRGTRVLPGLVDHIHGKEGAAQRRALVAASAKPDCMILDFVGNSTRHRLVSTEDVLGGNYSDEEIELAKKKRKTREGEDGSVLLKDARRELEQLAKATKAKTVKSAVEEFDPFQVFGMESADSVTSGRWGRKPVTDGQRGTLTNFGLREDEISKLDKGGASRLLDVLFTRRRANPRLASYRQQKTLREHGITDNNITFERAGAAITYLSSKGYGKTGTVDPVALNEILYLRRRQPGE